MKSRLTMFLLAIMLVCIGDIVSAVPVATPRYVETTKKKDATHVLTVTWSLPGVVEKKTETAYFRSPRNKDDVGFTGASVGSADGKNGGYTCQMHADAMPDGINVSLSISWTVRPAKGSTSVQFPVKYAENQKGSIAGLTYEVSWTELKNSCSHDTTGNQTRIDKARHRIGHKLFNLMNHSPSIRARFSAF